MLFSDWSYLGRVGSLTCLIWFIILVIERTSSAQYMVDPTFAPKMARNVGIVNAIEVQPDQKIIIGGSFGRVNGEDQIGIGRIFPDGSLDRSFSPIRVYNGNEPGVVSALLVQPDGRIIVAGNFSHISGQAWEGIARLNSNGSIDTSFGHNVFNGRNPFCLGLQSDGKILVGGGFTTVNNASHNNLVRLNSDGTLDQSLTTNVSGRVYSVQVLQGDKFLIGGEFGFVNQLSRNRIARLNANGTPDTNFLNNLTGINPSLGGAVYSILVQSDGRIVLAGDFGSVNSVQRSNLARLNTDGTLDGSFQNGLSGLDRSASALGQLSDGRILVAGAFLNVNGEISSRLACLTSSGELDTTFARHQFGENTSGFLSIGIRDIGILDNGEFFAGGLFQQVDNVFRSELAKFDSSGILSNSFTNVWIDSPASVSQIRVQPDGKILVSGVIRSVNGIFAPHLIRLNPDGSVDQSFRAAIFENVTISEAGSIISDLVVQPDGRIILAGNFEFFSPQGSGRYLTRINIDGSLDSSFTQRVSSGLVSSVGLQLDGKLIIGGTFSFIGNQARNNLARLNTDGSLDNTFLNGSAGANGGVSDVAVQVDGKIMVSGSFTQFNGVPRPLLARVNPNGNLDQTFSLDNYLGQASAIEPVPDGYYAAGRFQTASGPLLRPYLLKLSPTGVVDPSFSPAITGDFSGIRSILAQSDSKLIVAGIFDSINGVPTKLARLNPNGSIDSSFPNVIIEDLFDSQTWALSKEADGSLLVGGQFVRADNQLKTGLFRLRLNAATATITGRLLTPAGLALRNTAVTLVDDNGARLRSTTSSFGTFQFEGAPTGRPFVLTVSSKRYRFSPVQISNLQQDLFLGDIFGLE